jgi:hypothetical protein
MNLVFIAIFVIIAFGGIAAGFIFNKRSEGRIGFLAGVITILAAILAAFFGLYLLDYPDLGIITAIAVMGGYIIYAIERKK